MGRHPIPASHFTSLSLIFHNLSLFTPPSDAVSANASPVLCAAYRSIPAFSGFIASLFAILHPCDE